MPLAIASRMRSASSSRVHLPLVACTLLLLLALVCSPRDVSAAPAAASVVYRSQAQSTFTSVDAALDLNFFVGNTLAADTLSIQLSCINSVAGSSARLYPAGGPLAFPALAAGGNLAVPYVAPSQPGVDTCSVLLTGSGSSTWSYKALNSGRTAFEAPNEVTGNSLAFVLNIYARDLNSMARVDYFPTGSFSSAEDSRAMNFNSDISVALADGEAYVIQSTGVILRLTNSGVTTFGTVSGALARCLYATDASLVVLTSSKILRLTSGGSTATVKTVSNYVGAVDRTYTSNLFYVDLGTGVVNQINSVTGTEVAAISRIQANAILKLAVRMDSVQGRAVILLSDGRVYVTSSIISGSAGTYTQAKVGGANLILPAAAILTLSPDASRLWLTQSNQPLQWYVISDLASGTFTGPFSFPASTTTAFGNMQQYPTRVAFSSQSSYVYVYNLPYAGSAQPYNAQGGLYTLSLTQVPSLSVSLYIGRAYVNVAPTGISSRVSSISGLQIRCVDNADGQVVYSTSVTLQQSTSSNSWGPLAPRVYDTTINCTLTGALTGRDAPRWTFPAAPITLIPSSRVYVNGRWDAASTVSALSASHSSFAVSILTTPTVAFTATVTCTCPACPEGGPQPIVFTGSPTPSVSLSFSPTLPMSQLVSFNSSLASPALLSCSVTNDDSYVNPAAFSIQIATSLQAAVDTLPVQTGVANQLTLSMERAPSTNFSLAVNCTMACATPPCSADGEFIQFAAAAGYATPTTNGVVALVIDGSPAPLAFMISASGGANATCALSLSGASQFEFIPPSPLVLSLPAESASASSSTGPTDAASSTGSPEDSSSTAPSESSSTSSLVFSTSPSLSSTAALEASSTAAESSSGDLPSSSGADSASTADAEPSVSAADSSSAAANGSSGSGSDSDNGSSSPDSSSAAADDDDPSTAPSLGSSSGAGAGGSSTAGSNAASTAAAAGGGNSGGGSDGSDNLDSTSSSDLSRGDVAGLVVGLGGAALIVGVVVLVVLAKRARRAQDGPADVAMHQV